MRVLRGIVMLGVVLGVVVSCGAEEGGGFVQTQDLCVGGEVWLRTVTAPCEPANREATYKVYTHVMDFEGAVPITKGAGGKYTHHRGLFIGWSDTLLGGEDYDTWHMSNCFQRHENWQALEMGEAKSRQVETVLWYPGKGGANAQAPFIEETREITAAKGEDGLRVIDFASTLLSKTGAIELRGDLQHAGMQIRMANEVSEHQDTTQYILPEGGEELEDDKVVGAWWVCGSPVVRGSRYWIVHMTPPDHVTGVPVYSIRRYARFGAFFEPDLKEGVPLKLKFRIVVSKNELDRAACQRLYDAYAASAQ